MRCSVHHWSSVWSRGLEQFTGQSSGNLKATCCSLINVMYVSQVDHTIMRVKKQVQAMWFIQSGRVWMFYFNR